MKKYVDILIVPQGQQPSHNLRISTLLAKALLIFFMLWMVVLIGVTIFYSKVSYRAMQAGFIEQENERLRDYNARVVEIEKGFRKNHELVARIASLAGIELGDVSATPAPHADSLKTDSLARGAITGIPADNIPLSPAELEKIRVPKGRPLYGWITRGFVEGDDKEKHHGVDIAVKEGTQISVTATGVVVFAGWDKAFGNMIIVDHENGYKTAYGHNQKNLAGKGEKVYRGDIIALSGNTGRSSAPHLHYEIIKEGEAIDPSPYLD
jgi:murein DD-endopeptidase MepM/ murein hydrolase activator NlpD